MRDDLLNKSQPPTSFPHRVGNRIISDRHLTTAEIVARREEKAALAKARKYRDVGSKELETIDGSDIKPVDAPPKRKPGRPKKETTEES